MFKIYLITDCHNNKYVGQTTQKLKYRLQKHKYSKKYPNRVCSSNRLNLDDCKIELLEECNKENRFEREKYWINNIDCVNDNKYNFDKKEYGKKYREENKEKIKEKRKDYFKEYHKKNKDTKNQERQYRCSFGGDERYYNNLLKIDIDLFN